LYEGSCLCGKVKISFSEISGDYVFCHCKSCRKSSGSAFAANVSVPVNSLEVDGSEYVNTYESSPGKLRHFCSVCASPLFTKVGSNPLFARVRLGCLDTEFSVPPKGHIFVGSKASWEPIQGEVPCFDTWPPDDEIQLNGSHQPKT
jgi:hypothetical protein